MRVIDGDRLDEGLKMHRQPTDQKHEADRQWAVGYNAGLDRALHSIYYAPTLTPPNEPRMINADKLAKRIAGHSNYHGDSILAAVYCAAEGKENDAPIRPIETPPNDPLTPDQLREMEGDPVWVEFEDGSGGLWGIVHITIFAQIVFANGLHCTIGERYYGKSYKAYRRPPEGDE